MTWTVVAIIVAVAAVAAGLVLLALGVDPALPSLNEAERVAKLTLKQARRIVVGVVGVTLLIVGVIMIVAPGPALVVIPLGLAVLASEFVWARRLLVRYKGYANNLARRVGKATPWRPRPWMVGVAMGLTVVGAGLAAWLTDWPGRWILSVTTSMLIMEGVTMYLVVTGIPGVVATNNPATSPPTEQGDKP
jgi:hypothetical protein